MKTLTTFALVALIFLIGCTGSPTAPTTTHEPADWPEWNIQVEGVNHTLTLDSMLGSRTLNAGVEPGTDMNRQELDVYFAVNIVKANFPEAYWCPVYQIFYPMMAAQLDSTVFGWVVLMEFHGYDVPKKDASIPIPPDAIC